MAFSSIAAIVNDYAVTEAKRSGSERITRLHVLIAVSRFREERFEAEFPGMADGLRRRASNLKGSALKPTGYDSDLETALESVRAESDLWELASKIASELPADPSSDEASGVSRAAAAAADSASSADQRSEPTERAGDAAASGEPTPFPLTAEFAQRVAGVLGVPSGEAVDLLAKDALWVCTFVSGTELPEFHEVVAASLGIEGLEPVPPTDRSDFVGQLVKLQTAESSSVARELAVMHVAVATWAAAADADVSDDEVARIDELRLRLRGELEGAVQDADATVDVFDRIFDGLIGMESVKAELRSRIDHYIVAQRRRARGLSTSPQSMHMAFLGNPGTGKTEVARRYASVLREMGLLSGGQMIEVDRSGLVGQYVGQTEKRTSDVVARARGGVLFIDEAYSVAADAGDAHGYGQQIIDILVKSLEDYRDDLVVIFAGYEKPMANFFASNPGLRSRVPTMIGFVDYSTLELTEIVQRMAEDDGYTLTQEAKVRLAENADRLRTHEGFGNARTVRNLYEEALRTQSSRLAELGELATRAEMQEIRAEDVPQVDVEVDNERVSFGFARRSVSD